MRKVFELGRSLKDPVQSQHRPAAFSGAGAGARGGQGGHRRRAQRLHASRRASRSCATKSRPGLIASIGHADREVILTSGTSGGAGAGAAGHRQSGRRGDPVRSVLRRLSGDGHAGRRRAGLHRHLSEISTSTWIEVDGGDHAADQGDPLQCAGQSVRRRAAGGRDPRFGRLAERRGMLLISDEIYRSFNYGRTVHQPGDVQRADAGGGRLRQDLRHHRLAARIMPTGRER